MKSSIPWVLISSMIAFSCYSHLLATEATLSTADSFDGNTASGTFTPLSSASTYSLSGNVFFTNPGKGAALSDSCFKQDTENLTFLGNGHSLNFSFLDSGAHPSAASSTGANKNLIFSDFSLLRFDSSPNVKIPTGLGTLSSAGGVNFERIGRLIFSGNFSTGDGGAIKGTSCSLSEVSSEAIFTDNSSSTKGGAIATTAGTNITNNKGFVRFLFNTATTSGGAINDESSSTLAHNKSLYFERNSAKTTGGAISSSKTGGSAELTLSNNENLIFLENSSGTSGGAISAQKLTLSSGGFTEFRGNNVSSATPKGGAINIESSGELNLSAEGGNIIFIRNTITSSGNTNPPKRNAINIGNNGKFTELRATKGHAIFFYDPITSEGTSSDVLQINNGPVGTPNPYEGTILFSGDTLTSAEFKVAENLKSSFTQPVNLSGGKLLLQKGVTLESTSFNQNASSLLGMDLGTTLQTTSGGITITNLGINVDSLDLKQPIQLTAKGSGSKVIVSGNLNLIDFQGNIYENHMFSHDQLFSLLKITVDADVSTNVDINNLTPSPTETPSSEYGYQGKWTVTWATDTTKNTTEATATWTKTGFVPSPERKSALLCNTLWGVFTDIRSLQQLVEVGADGIEHKQGFWISSMTNFLHKIGTEECKGFRHTSGGYIIGTSTHTPKDDLFTFAFCHLFARDKDCFIAHNNSRTYGGTLFFRHSHTLQPQNYLTFGRAKLPESAIKKFPKEIPLALDLQFSFSHSDNHMETHYTSLQETEGSWSNECIAGSIGLNLPISFSDSHPLFQSFVPQMKVEMVYISQNSFFENSVEGRGFSSGRLLNLSIPIGAKFVHGNVGESYTYDLAGFFVADVYRNNPHSLATLVMSKDSWKIQGENLSRQAFLLRGSNNYVYNSKCELFGHYAMELRGSSRNYNVDIGTKLRF
ncbi:Polymorphic membrane protein F,chlamydial polymorphic outer membrane protein repeat,Autotransporter beta-domain [Chlamydia serpentis]|uniref:Polymorphic membrane protein F,chlamydial polymorphic outer membrane protein repeat,Autotransporter beta-domain n=1 Tax=Chlamydia serpentis TaxID=1967782 RepID=A0A2R8FB05_9CHLA|nr:polymorphic outer membrane protein middle domain-containing protein [Chlamydia serpentis]SPN73584.1 Polymorphic membrane protein F,chlamydial polymorphic outer membrane protein repeat,Autotransporter beta-domain [Chlamydia serpentis]